MLPEIAAKYHAKVAEYERNYCAAGKPSFYVGAEGNEIVKKEQA